ACRVATTSTTSPASATESSSSTISKQSIDERRKCLVGSLKCEINPTLTHSTPRVLHRSNQQGKVLPKDNGRATDDQRVSGGASGLRCRETGGPVSRQSELHQSC